NMTEEIQKQNTTIHFVIPNFHVDQLEQTPFLLESLKPELFQDTYYDTPTRAAIKFNIRIRHRKYSDGRVEWSLKQAFLHGEDCLEHQDRICKSEVEVAEVLKQLGIEGR